MSEERRLSPAPEGAGASLVRGIATIEAAARQLPPEELADVITALQSASTRLLLSAVARPPDSAREEPDEDQDRVLTVIEAATRLGRSRWWIYRNKAALPLVRFPTGGYGISAAGLARWIRGRNV